MTMFTLEQKIDIALGYIGATELDDLAKYRELAKKALQESNTLECTADVEDLIMDLLKEVGVPPHLIGHRYIVCAIQLTLNNREYLRAITTGLYSDIADKFNTNNTRVERAIRHAIESAFDRGDPDVIFDIFGNIASISKGKITNAEFIAASVNEISSRMRKLGIAAK